MTIRRDSPSSDTIVCKTDRPPFRRASSAAESSSAGGPIFVSKAPMFTAAECSEVIALAEAEGGGLPSTKSGYL